MALVDIPFTRSSMPGQRPGEGQGRNINALCEMDGAVATWRPAAGLRPFADTSYANPRGFIAIGDTLFSAYEDQIAAITAGGAVTTLAGTVPGTDLVTIARNNRAPTADVLMVTDQDIYEVTATTVTAFIDADLPKPNSITSLDGYFLFTIGDGRVFASDLNDTNVNALSFATCQSSPDGLLRGTTSGQLFYGWGSSTTEVWQNVGTTPFPLSRVSVIPVGLLAPNAVAGWEPGWDQGQIFVAPDFSVRRLNGYEPVRISTKDVERAIQALADKGELSATVYVAGGHAIWSLSSSQWTWEFNTTTGFWHERKSLFMPRWRARASCLFGASWVVGDTASTKVQIVDEAAFTEDGQPLPMILESGPAKQFPSRLQVPNAFFDWTTGQGVPIGVEDATGPVVLVEWSHDGGGSWSNPLERSIGGQGEFAKQVRINRLGLTTHHGMRFRQTTSSPVYRTFRGGRFNVNERRP